MNIRQLLASVLGFAVITGYVGVAAGAENFRWKDIYSEETGATTVWEDWFGYEQACGFDFRVDYNDKYTVHVFNDREIWNVLIRDTYTNHETGFSFEDFASYTVVYDYETGFADHHGVFWRIRVPGEGMLILDVGGFVQDWDGDWSILPGTVVGNNHDVNVGALPSVSYCDLMNEIFPE